MQKKNFLLICIAISIISLSLFSLKEVAPGGPIPPHTVWGYVSYSNGSMAPGIVVYVKNERTGDVLHDTSEYDSYWKGTIYNVDLYDWEGREYANGMIDNVRIYNRALSSTEIEDNYNGNIVTDGLISQWKFNTGSGNTAHDSADGNNGIIHGANWVPHGSKYALSFDGADDYVKIPHSTNYKPTNAITIEAWIYIDDLDISHFGILSTKWNHLCFFVDKNDGDLYNNDNDSRLIWRQEFSDGNNWLRSDIKLSTGTWYQVVATYNKNKMRI